MYGVWQNRLNNLKEFNLYADNLNKKEKKEQVMEIIFHGQQDWEKSQENIMGIIQMLHDQYKITHLREIHISLTLMDEEGFDVELIDTETNETYRVMEVFRNHLDYQKVRQASSLKLVVDNTKKE
jgi:hypothetical protein